MQAINTRIDTQAAAYQENREAMTALVAELEANLAKSRFQGNDARIERARKNDQYLASERIRLLLDQDSPFLELLPLGGLGIRGGFGPGGTVIAGIGLVAGRLTMISASIGTHKGGSVDYASAFKNVRINEITLENRLPCVQLVESGGANLPDQFQMFNLAGSHFREMTRRSAEGLTTVSVVFGNATAGGAYVPGMSDHAILVKDKARVFLAGPPLLKMATNEIAGEEELGGAEMHSRISGVSDYLAEDELDGIRLARDIMATLEDPPVHAQPARDVDEPLYDADELLGIVQADIKKPFDAREVIARVVDGSRFLDFKPEYGATMVCGWAEIHGYKVGILANNGVLFSESANKATQFIQLCNRNNTPLVFLQNITGFMVGKEYEQGGIIKHGSHLINAVSNSKVPSVTINMAASYGAGNYAMNGRSYQPRFLFTYPNSRVSVMGSEQIAGVMEIIQRTKAEREGVPFDEQQFAMIKGMITKENDEKSNAWYATGQLWDEGIIDPRQTRNVLAMCLAVFNQQPIKGSEAFGVFRF